MKLFTPTNIKSVFILILISVFTLSSCQNSSEKIISSVGKYDDHVSYTRGEFQDHTDYAKYYFSSTDISNNKYFVKVKDSDQDKINRLLDNFESLIYTYKEADATQEIVAKYDFDKTCIDEEDHIYIEYEESVIETLDNEKTLSVFLSYDIYFFDVQTQILYYFHNNL